MLEFKRVVSDFRIRSMKGLPFVVGCCWNVWVVCAQDSWAVQASEYWNEFRTDGQECTASLYLEPPSQTWRDWTVNADPQQGWTFPFWFGTKYWTRVPSATVFQLVVCTKRVDTTCQPFHDGITVPTPIYAFANDVRGWYWNNAGALTLRVETQCTPPEILQTSPI